MSLLTCGLEKNLHIPVGISDFTLYSDDIVLLRQVTPGLTGFCFLADKRSSSLELHTPGSIRIPERVQLSSSHSSPFVFLTQNPLTQYAPVSK